MWYNENVKNKYEFSGLAKTDIKEYQRLWWLAHSSEYKAERARASRVWRLENLGYCARRQRRRREERPEEAREIERRRYLKNRGQRLDRSLEYYRVNANVLRGKSRKRTLERKARVLTHYGSGKLACVNCGFSDIRALSIDHINNDGYIERKRDKGLLGDGLYKRLERSGYPEGYQTLCMNCQWVKRMEHLEEKR